MPDNLALSSKTELGSLELTEEYIQLRAYQLFEKRGYEHGHDVEDWLEAEAEVVGTRQPTLLLETTEKKPISSEKKATSAAAA